MNRRDLEAILRSADPKQLEHLKNMVEGSSSETIKRQLEQVDAKTLERAFRQFNITDDKQKQTVEQLLTQVKRNPAMIDQLKKKL